MIDIKETVKTLVLGTLVGVGAWSCLAQEPVLYLDPVFDVRTGAATGMVSRICSEYTALGGSYSEDLTLVEGWYVVTGDCSIVKSKSVKTVGHVNLILMNGTSFVKTEADDHTGFLVEQVSLVEQGSLSVYAQSTFAELMGVLQIKGGKYGAAIGSGSKDNVANAPITINGGKVTATGGQYGAAIGSGKTATERSAEGAGQNITINGGIVTAIGGEKSAGIGGGEKSIGQDITINGGTVVATGGAYGAGIGGGNTQDGARITINGGHVTANGGEVAAGIGGGKKGPGYKITINGGTVVATGGSNSQYGGGAGIGGGNDDASDSRGEGYDITINSGHVTATGGRDAAGIGGSGIKDGHHITINGGTVIASGKENGAGIGGGDGGNGNGNGYYITINGGNVTATGEEKAAGIGGGDDANGHHITINGGYVDAKCLRGGGAGIGGGQGRNNGKGGDGYEILIGGGEVHAWTSEKGAGIGGGDNGVGYSISITNGYVEATCSKGGGAGIGGGDAFVSLFKERYFAYNITISGGEVHATGADGGAGIGAPNDSFCNNITISGGKIVAKSFNNDDTVVGGAGIGGGDGVEAFDPETFKSGTITITGGDITATGGIGAAGIGGGYHSSVVDVTITGGEIKAYGGIKGGAGIGGGGRWGAAHYITISGGKILAMAGGSCSYYDPEEYKQNATNEWTALNCWWSRGMDIGGGGTFDVEPVIYEKLTKLAKFIPKSGWLISGVMKLIEGVVKLVEEYKDMTPEHYGTVYKIWIKDGTIEAHSIGGSLPEQMQHNIFIDGGSVLAMAMSVMPMNSYGYAVVPIQFKEAGASSPAKLYICGSENRVYNTKELYPDEYGDLYLWLTTGTYDIAIDNVSHKMNVEGRWHYTLDGQEDRVQLGDTVWATLQNGFCYVYGQGAMWSTRDDGHSNLWVHRGSITNVIVDGEVTTLGKRTFEGLEELRDVTITTTNVVTFADKTLYMCQNLTSVSIAAGAQRIGANALQECGSLESLKSDADVAEIDPTAFRLTAYIRMEGDDPIVTGLPKVEIPNYETVNYGKKTLTDTDDWALVTDANKPDMRFFKVICRPVVE